MPTGVKTTPPLPSGTQQSLPDTLLPRGTVRDSHGLADPGARPAGEQEGLRPGRELCPEGLLYR